MDKNEYKIRNFSLIFQNFENIFFKSQNKS